MRFFFLGCNVLASVNLSTASPTTVASSAGRLAVEEEEEEMCVGVTRLAFLAGRVFSTTTGPGSQGGSGGAGGGWLV